MMRVRTSVSGFCFRVSKARMRTRSPKLQTNPAYNSMKASQKDEYYDNDCGSSFTSETTASSNSTKSESKDGNRIMIVADASPEAMSALQWALSHTVQKEDTIILLHIVKPSKCGTNSESDVDPKAYGLLYSMKRACETRRPGVQVELVAKAGKDKGPIIVDQAKEQRASLLVLGHRRRTMAWRLLMRWTGRRRSSHSVVDYCIQNADCMTIAVRRKSKKLGGYLITTKRHKNFWLLA